MTVSELALTHFDQHWAEAKPTALPQRVTNINGALAAISADGCFRVAPRKRVVPLTRQGV